MKEDILDKIIAYEMGELNDIETIKLFSKLVQNGNAWSLQGHYGRTATALIRGEYLTSAGQITDKIYELE
jgi:hypothetical protein